MPGAEIENAVFERPASASSPAPRHARVYVTDRTVGSDGAPPEPAQPQPPPDEISSLKRKLAEEESARLRAFLTVTDLERQLAEAERVSAGLRMQLEAGPESKDPDESVEKKLAELAELKKHLRQFQKEVAAEQQSRRAELAGVRVQLFNAQKLLQTERRTRKLETSHATAQAQRLESDLGAARALIASARKARKAERQTWLIAGMGTVMAFLAVAVFVLWQQQTPRQQMAPASGSETQATAPAPSVPAPSVPASSGSAQPGPAPASPGLSGAVQHAFASRQEFASDIGRLNHALDGFHGRSPEEVLREVHRKNLLRGNSVCAFQWNGGQPSMLLSGSGSGANPLTSAIAGCAEAVESYR